MSEDADLWDVALLPAPVWHVTGWRVGWAAGGLVYEAYVTADSAVEAIELAAGGPVRSVGPGTGVFVRSGVAFRATPVSVEKGGW